MTLVNKIDLLPHLDFSLELCLAFARQVNPDIEVLCVSARSGEGMQAWYGWLRQHLGQELSPPHSDRAR